jgi:membrane protease YdiL (CAAX protease family)
LKGILIAGCSILAPGILYALFGTLPQYLGYTLSPLYMASTMVVGTLASIPVIIFFARKYNIEIRTEIRILDTKTIIFIIILSVVIFILTPLIAHPVTFINKIAQNKINILIPGIQVFDISFIIFSISKVFLGPIFEEIIFRGIIYKLLKRTYSTLFSVFFSSLLFTLVHFNYAGNGIIVFVYGVLFCLMYFKTKSLLAPIVFHILINFLSQVTINYSFDINTLNLSIYIPIVTASVLVLVFFFRYTTSQNSLLWKQKS